MKHYLSHSVAETNQIAEAFGRLLRPGDIVAYSGGMGAGKTTFTHGVVKGLGIDAFVSSPTFALVNEYAGPDFSVFHFDMYRIGSYDDLLSTGFFDYCTPENILLIEWSENIAAELPRGTIQVRMEPRGETVREITIEGDERF